ncbi:MAG: DUF2946 domain-containing protein [Betaproteobacteria bacterium]|nr:DUF2946 domain-containing protein [Betaproteobacteria bacterium]
MNRSRVNRLHAWIALMAMAWALLAPAVSQALAARSADAAAWTEICSTANGPQAGTSGKESDGAGRLHRALNHCPLCALSLDKLTLTTAPFTWTGVCLPAALAARPLTFSPVTLLEFRPPVRGPPAFQVITFLV